MRATPNPLPDHASPAIIAKGAGPNPWQREEHQSRRRYRRWAVNLRASISVVLEPRACSVFDLSPAGARIRLLNGDTLAQGTEVLLELDGFGTVPAEIRHTVEGFTGLMFLLDEASEIRLARHLVGLQPDRRQHPRESSHATATLRPRSGDTPCIVENISRTGANILVNDTRHLMEGDDLSLRIAGFGDIAAIVRRVDDGEVALLFHRELVGELPFPSA